MGVGQAAREDLWAHAGELIARAGAEADLPALRRALVTYAVAGAGTDPEGFRERIMAACATARRLGLDPEPLFDAAGALAADDDPAAREALMMAPRSMHRP